MRPSTEPGSDPRVVLGAGGRMWTARRRRPPIRLSIGCGQRWSRPRRSSSPHGERQSSASRRLPQLASAPSPCPTLTWRTRWGLRRFSGASTSSWAGDSASYSEVRMAPVRHVPHPRWSLFTPLPASIHTLAPTALTFARQRAPQPCSHLAAPCSHDSHNRQVDPPQGAGRRSAPGVRLAGRRRSASPRRLRTGSRAGAATGGASPPLRRRVRA